MTQPVRSGTNVSRRALSFTRSIQGHSWQQPAMSALQNLLSMIDDCISFYDNAAMVAAGSSCREAA